MHKTRIAALLLLLLCCGAALAQGPRAALRIEDLRCEYLKDPLGIDVARPRLSWILQSDQRGQKQTACQVLVASTPEQLAKDQGARWDSGKVPSNRSVQVVYDGAPLTSRDRCYWKVRVWDKDGQATPWSDAALWSMGLLEAADWSAPWIHAGPEKGTVQDKAAETAPSPWFRKTFTLDAVPELRFRLRQRGGLLRVLCQRAEGQPGGARPGGLRLPPAVVLYDLRYWPAAAQGEQLHRLLAGPRLAFSRAARRADRRPRGPCASGDRGRRAHDAGCHRRDMEMVAQSLLHPGQMVVEPLWRRARRRPPGTTGLEYGRVRRPPMGRRERDSAAGHAGRSADVSAQPCRRADCLRPLHRPGQRALRAGLRHGLDGLAAAAPAAPARRTARGHPLCRQALRGPRGGGHARRTDRGGHERRAVRRRRRKAPLPDLQPGRRVHLGGPSGRGVLLEVQLPRFSLRGHRGASRPARAGRRRGPPGRERPGTGGPFRVL